MIFNSYVKLPEGTSWLFTALSCDFLRTMCNIVKPPQAPDPRLRGTLRIRQGPEGLLLAAHIKNTPTDPGSILGKITHQAASVADISSSSITQAPPRAPRPSGRWDVYTWSAHRSPVASWGILKWWQWRGTCSAPKMARGYNQQRYSFMPTNTGVDQQDQMFSRSRGKARRIGSELLKRLAAPSKRMLRP